jgi:sec-independent protein translocase protein TatC
LISQSRGLGDVYKRQSWRIAVFLSALLAAMATPTADPMSMFFLMIPLIALFYLAVGISALHDKAQSRKLANQE